MKNAPHAAEDRLDAMKYCIHSEIHGASLDKEAGTIGNPDYYCCLKVNRPFCRLYRDPACSKREPFPESYNT